MTEPYVGQAVIGVGTAEDKGLLEQEAFSENERVELDFLRYFYESVEHVMGPTSDDIYASILEDWIREGNAVPEGYSSGE